MSRGLFGATYRLEICAALEEGVSFCVNDLALLLGDPPGKGQVSSEIKKLREIGFVTELRSPRSDRTKPFVAAQVGLWQASRDLKRYAERMADEAIERERLIAVALASMDSVIGRSSE